MFVRIVKMGFEPSKTEAFLTLFHNHKHMIRNFEGCQFLELYQDKNQENIFFTYSYWNNERYLEMYRNSDLFKSLWSQTKVLFNTKPEAWSVDKRVSLP